MISLRTFELSAGPKSAKIVSVPASDTIDAIKDKIFNVLDITPDHSAVTFHTTKNKKIDTTALPTKESIASIGLQDNSILILRKKPDLQLRAKAGGAPSEVKPVTPASRMPHTPVAISVKGASVVDAVHANSPAVSVPQPLRPLRATEEQPPTPVLAPVKVTQENEKPGSPPSASSPLQSVPTVARASPPPPVPAAKTVVPLRAPLPPSPTIASKHKQASPSRGAEKAADTPQISELKQKIQSLQAEKEELKEKLRISCESSARQAGECEGLSQRREGWSTHRASLFALLRQVHTIEATYVYQNAAFVEKTHAYLLTVFFSKVERSDLDVSALLQRYGGAMDMLYRALAFQFKLTRTPKYAAVHHFVDEHIPDLSCAVPVICHLYYNREPEFLEELFFALRGSRPSASTWVHVCLPHGRQLYYSAVCRFGQPLCPAVAEATPCTRVDVASDTATCHRLGLSNRRAEDQHLTTAPALSCEIVGAMLTGRETADMLFHQLERQQLRADQLLGD